MMSGGGITQNLAIDLITLSSEFTRVFSYRYEALNEFQRCILFIQELLKLGFYNRYSLRTFEKKIRYRITFIRGDRFRSANFLNNFEE